MVATGKFNVDQYLAARYDMMGLRRYFRMVPVIKSREFTRMLYYTGSLLVLSKIYPNDPLEAIYRSFREFQNLHCRSTLSVSRSYSEWLILLSRYLPVLYENLQKWPACIR